ncbi:YbjN domain-containing protein [Roseateles amylovorans]|uniref:YbjN domain-containing protein n=1 Tax=Roseateles amylovorans TaxID=2978473 RepID=A0ABY6AW59_9BURK|nr:YbjN domain-containing protein [Roseateles amylovorans]UXH77411.1 YbjN domain-containing protein [Roseateles amylovorans]
MAEAIRAAGCAVTPVERDGVIHLQSASHGVGFQVLWGNVMSPGRFADLTMSCAMRVQAGTLPEGLLGEWHRAKRFARAAQHGDFVALELDIVAAGGITQANLQVMMQLWVQMMGEFFLHLRSYSPAKSA